MIVGEPLHQQNSFNCSLTIHFMYPFIIGFFFKCFVVLSEPLSEFLNFINYPKYFVYLSQILNSIWNFS